MNELVLCNIYLAQSENVPYPYTAGLEYTWPWPCIKRLSLDLDPRGEPELWSCFSLSITIPGRITQDVQ